MKDKQEKVFNVRAVKGHVRGHLLHLNSPKKSDNMQKNQLGTEDNEHMSDKLREIPRNCFWVSSKAKQKGQSFVCKQCEKGFKSPRAVFGHMRCHSKRKTGDHVQLCTTNMPRKKRSIGRYKINTSCCSTNSSWSNMKSCSSSLTEFDEKLEDIAASLLMLANGGFYSVDHYVSEDDSVKMEPRFLKCGNKMDLMGVCNDDHGTEGVLTAEPGLKFDVQKCGYDEYKEKTQEFPGSDCGRLKTKPENFECKPVSDAELESEIKDGAIGVFPADLFDNLDPSTCGPTAEELKNKTVNVFDRVFDSSKPTAGASALMTNPDYIKTGPTVSLERTSELFESEIKDETSGVYKADTKVNSLNPTNCDPLVLESKHERIGLTDQAFDKCNSGTSGQATDNCCSNQCQKYICNICNKNFSSRQALGGHRLHCPLEKRFCHTQGNKKTWRHKCLVCCKAFPSGQALGGHMRAHFHANVQCNKTEFVACGKEISAATEDEKKELSDAYDDTIPAAAIEERKLENEACSNKIQQLFKEKEMTIIPQGNNPCLSNSEDCSLPTLFL